MRQVVIRGHSDLAVPGAPIRRRAAACVRALAAAMLLAALLVNASPWSALVFAGEREIGSSTTTDVEHADEAEATPEPTVEPSVEPAEEENVPTQAETAIPTFAPEQTESPTEVPAPTFTPTPTPAPSPRLVLAATAECTAGGNYFGLLTLDVADAPATIAEIRAIAETGTTTPVRLAVQLPATLAPDAAHWQWWIDAPVDEVAAMAPTSLLVRVVELPGDEVANRAAGSSGWLLVPLASPVSDCPLPTPLTDPTLAPESETLGGSGAESVPESMATPTLEATTAPTDPFETPESPTEPTETPTPDAATATSENTSDSGESPSPPASPTLHATETATTEPGEEATPEPIEIVARSADRGVHPRESARYRFRVTNTTDEAIVTRLETIDSTEGWTSKIFASDGMTELAEPVRLEADESIDVIVRVYPPVAVRAGDQNTTTLDATILDPDEYVLGR